MSRILIIEDEEAIADWRKTIWNCPDLRLRFVTEEIQG